MRVTADLLTACGERVGLVTRARAWACQIDEGAAHRPPPFPPVLALDPWLLERIFNFSGRERRMIVADHDSDCSADGSIRHVRSEIDFSALCCDMNLFLRNKAAPPWRTQ